MTRWLITVVAVLIALGTVVWAQSRSVTLAVGRLGGSETTESDECYFAIGQGAALMLHPKGEYCPIVRGLLGTTGRLVWVVD